MANVFISYERSSEPFARKVKAALLAAGHEPWSDDELPPHRAYSDVIQERLSAADAVLVLWSEAADRSQWVRAEAEFARERGKLVQVSLDDSVPPLPFNQIQRAHLQGWKGERRDPEWRKVLQSIEAFAPQAGVAAGDTLSLSRPVARPRPARIAWLVACVALVFALAAGGWWFFDRTAAPRRPARVAVLPFQILSESPDARFFAEGLNDQILSALSDNKIEVVSHDDAESLRGPDRAKRIKDLGVALLFTGSIENDGKTISVRVHIDDAVHHASLWTGGVQGPAANGPALQKQIANTAVSVLACSSRALKPVNGLSDPDLLGRYLRACDLFVNQEDATGTQATFEMLGDLRIVTAGAPNFAPAHSDLAKFDAYLAPLLPPEQAEPMRQEAVREAARALQIEPKSPDAYLAREMLLPTTEWAAREALLRQGVAVDPQWPHTNGFLSKFLMETGRVQDAQVYAARASAADLQIDWRPMGAILGCGAGRFDEKISFLTGELLVRPDNLQIRGALGTCLAEAGRFREARASIDPERLRTTPWAAAQASAKDAWWKAADERTPANLAAAKQQLLSIAAASNGGLTVAIEGFAQLGMLDEAFTLLDGYTPGHPTTGSEGAFLFFPQTAPLRRDPRFMRFAARVGLASFWKTSGKWPDFCAMPGQPYDCRVEAERWLKP